MACSISLLPTSLFSSAAPAFRNRHRPNIASISRPSSLKAFFQSAGDLRPELDDNPEAIISGEWTENFSLLSYEDLLAYLRSQIPAKKIVGLRTPLREVMSSAAMRIVKSEQSVAEIASHFEFVSGLPVVDDELQCLGVLSKNDLRRAENELNSKVVEIMSSPAITLPADKTVKVSFVIQKNLSTVELLSGSNFKKWKSDVMFALQMADVEMAITIDVPKEPTSESTTAEKDHYSAWSKSNKICLLAMKRTIPEHLLSGLPETNLAKDFLAAVGQRYNVSSNDEIGTLIQDLFSMKYTGEGVRDYILKMVFHRTKLLELGINLPEALIVHHALNTLPANFSILKTTYSSQDEAWRVNDLITRCVAEEEKLKKEKSHTALLVQKPQFKKKGPKASAKAQSSKPSGSKDVAASKKPLSCFFCKKKGHMKTECFKFKTWMEKRGFAIKGVHQKEEAKQG